MNEKLWRGRNCGCARWTELNMKGFFWKGWCLWKCYLLGSS
ncbi:hypothetical protein CFP56_042163 [Quercus suber]|uniref:Uncharacterized protein n=1 Tax=Quercus suber TaxID=58331 RepID=A0AAW0M9X5_QUESU